MTTLNGWSDQTPRTYTGVQDLLDRIDGVRWRRWTVALVTAALTGLAALLAAVLFAGLLGHWPGQPPAALRWTMFAVLLLAGGGLLAALVWRVAWRQNPAQTARFIEQAIPETRNDLINAVLLSRDESQPSPELVQRAIHEALHHAGPVELTRSVSFARAKRAALAFGLAALAVAGMAMFQPGPLGRGLVAAMTPWAFVPADNRVELVSLEPGDTELFPGQALDIRVTVAHNADEPIRAELLIDGADAPRPMFAADAADGNAAFQYRIPNVQEPLRYVVRVIGAEGSSRWPADRPWFHVGVRRTRIESFTAEYAFPPYLRRDKRQASLNPDGDVVSAPAGSYATLRLAISAPVGTSFLEFPDGHREAMTPADEGRTQHFRLPIDADGAFRIALLRDDGQLLKRLPNGDGKETWQTASAAPDGRWFRVEARADQPPTIAFEAPSGDTQLAAGGALPVMLRATDDHGLTAVHLLVARQGEQPSAVEGLPPVGADRPAEHRMQYAWKPEGVLPGDVFLLSARATDNRNIERLGGAQTAVTPTVRVTIVEPQAAADDKTKRLAELQKRLLAILSYQAAERVNTSRARHRAVDLAQVQSIARRVGAGQKNIHAALTDLVATYPWDDGLAEIRKAAALLTANEAALAIDQAEALAGIAALDARGGLCQPLADTQDAIIRTLQDMLAILPALAAKADPKSFAGGEDLTPDQRRDLREKLRTRLEEFLEQERKAILAAERLNKKPLDDFTPEDMELLKQQQALQDQWEKFLNEAYTDFSKLAQQDFANPSMLKELLSVKTDVTMAKDALSKKATEIATAAEESAVENAESLTANIEKWLPDEPDRTKWSMEALPEQQNTEQAELFNELEDLVGDLLEDEEDLFEEMDDLASKSMMSGDKGIGWDTLDGPISNMNAQGVTGNQLPNSSEISGRSGEGRTGKSAGEFVEDKAVGKGGRRTPTRLSDDPFQSGEINDVSDDPPGGATGGGKHSGQGEQGLEGPTPQEVARQMGLLSGKQAQLINRAERLEAKFQQSSYAAFQLRQAVMLMNRVKNDLDDGYYQNALRRQRQAVEALRQTRRMMDGDVEVTTDPTKTMPKYVRDEIKAAGDAHLPAEYEDVLRKYYERLSQQR